MTRRKTLPQVSPKVAVELRPLVSAIKEIIETGEGVRGDPLDRKLTLRDLVDSGIGKLRPGANAGNPNALAPNPAPPNLAVPPIPAGFNAIGGFDGRIDLTWEIPGSLYGNHAHTNVYRAETDNFANAILVGREAGAFYTDIVRDDVAPKPYYYWISFTSTSDIEGPLNSPSGTMAQALSDPGYIIEQITGLITESELAQALNSRIDKIEVNETAIATEQTVRADADEALASEISTISASTGDATAAIEAEQTARIDADEALATDITTVQTSVGDNTTSIQTNATSINGLSAQYTVKIDANGAVAGFGLASNPSSDTTSGQFSEFYVNADRFAVLPQGGDTSLDARAPFIVQGGVVYLDTAVIADASIAEGQIGAISFGKIEAADGTPITTVGGLLKADHIDVDNLSVASAATFYGDAASGNFATGTAGWKLWQTGNLEAYNATVRGRIEADTGYIASTLQIGGTSQNIGEVAQLANDAGNTAITVDNWKKPGTTYIAGSSIFADDIYVDTVNIEGQAVTFPDGRLDAESLSVGGNWTTIQSVAMDLTGAPIIITGSFALTKSSATSGDTASVRILVGGSLVFPEQIVARASQSGTDFQSLPEHSMDGSPSITHFIRTPGSGVKTIAIQCSGNTSFYCSNRSIAVIEAKR